MGRQLELHPAARDVMAAAARAARLDRVALRLERLADAGRDPWSCYAVTKELADHLFLALPMRSVRRILAGGPPRNHLEASR